MCNKPPHTLEKTPHTLEKPPHTLEKTPPVPNASKIQNSIETYQEEVKELLSLPCKGKDLSRKKGEVPSEDKEKRDGYEKEMLCALFDDYNNIPQEAEDDFKSAIQNLLALDRSNLSRFKWVRKNFLEENQDIFPSVFLYQNWVYEVPYLPKKTSLQVFYDQYLNSQEDREEEYDPQEEIPLEDNYD